MATNRKEAKCFTCGQQILIEKTSPNAPWSKYNLDGTEHKDPRKAGGVTAQDIQDIKDKIDSLKQTVDEIKAMMLER